MDSDNDHRLSMACLAPSYLLPKMKPTTPPTPKERRCVKTNVPIHYFNCFLIYSLTSSGSAISYISTKL